MPYADLEKRRQYQREYQLKRYHTRRAEFFKGKVCVDCGATTNLEMDHRDPKTKVTHKFWFWSRKKFEEEAAKCDPRCSECHKKRTAQQRPLKPCGTAAAYRRGCRCDECRRAQSIYKRENRMTRAKNFNSELPGSIPGSPSI